MPHTGDRIRRLRKERSLTQEQLGELLGVKKAAVAKYENGTVTNIKAHNIIKLAEALNTTPEYLLGWESDGDIVRLPILASVSAGMGIHADSLNNEAIGYEPICSDELGAGEQYVYLRVSGDSMYPMFIDGDLILVRCQTSVDSGSYAVVTIDNEDGVVKRIIYGKDFIELQSINPMYPPRRFEGRDITRIRVFGLVKQLKRNF